MNNKSPETRHRAVHPRLLLITVLPSLRVTIVLVALFSACLSISTVMASEGLKNREGLEGPPETSDEIAQLKSDIETLRDTIGPFDLSLFDPLIQLARLYEDAGEMDEARNALHEAQHIAHRNEGVYSPRQFPIIRALADMQMQQGEPLPANQLHKFLHYLSTHHHDAPDHIASNRALANWYMETGQYARARNLLEDTVESLQEADDTDPVAIAGLLITISKSRRLQSVCCAQRPLIEALELLQDHDQVPRDLLQTIYMELGDTEVLRHNEEEAIQYYQLATDIGNADGPPQLLSMSRQLQPGMNARKRAYKTERDPFGGTHLRRMGFDEQLSAQYQPPQIFIVPNSRNRYDFRIRDNRLGITTNEPYDEIVGHPFTFLLEQLVTILPIRLQNRQQLAEISVAATFSVDEFGQPGDIEITRSNAPIKVNRLVRDVIRKSKYRPALVDGEPVRADNVTLVQTFDAAG